MHDSPGWKRERPSVWRRLGKALLWIIGVLAVLVFAALSWSDHLSKDIQWAILAVIGIGFFNYHWSKHWEDVDRRHYDIIDRLDRLERMARGDYRG